MYIIINNEFIVLYLFANKLFIIENTIIQEGVEIFITVSGSSVIAYWSSGRIIKGNSNQRVATAGLLVVTSWPTNHRNSTE